MRRAGRSTFIFSLIALIGSIACGVAIGPVLIPIDETIKILFGSFFSWVGVDPTHVLIINQVRLPRVLLAALVGFALATCGAVMQGLFRNPLADPYLLGIASGATAGAALVIIFKWDKLALALPAGSFLGGLLAVSLVYQLSRGRFGRLDNLTLILAGVALAALFSALSSFMLYVANSDETRRIVFWVLGGLGGAQWSHVQSLFVIVLGGSMVMLGFAREINAFVLGEEMATHLGVQPEYVKKILMLATTLMTAGAVAFAGTIGFIGLIVPHAVRWIVGPNHRILIPVSGLCGATLLIACDTAARTIVQPAEIPVGIITALIGAPFFLFLLKRHGHRSTIHWSGRA